MNQHILKKIMQQINESKDIVIIQADNPDGDSLASSLALEQILHDMGKTPYMYCGVDMSNHLKYLEGWDRVTKDLPNKFDLSIIVDTTAINLLEQLRKNNQLGFVRSKPTIVIDHHDVENTIDFADILLVDPNAVSTGEVIYEVAQSLKWKLDINALNMLSTSILSDSLGLMTASTSARSIHIIGEMVEAGVKLPEIDEKRRKLSKKSKEILKYKAKLIERIEFFDNDRIATVDIPWREIEEYSSQYNPSILVLDEMRMTDDVEIAIAFKIYYDGKITGKIRANYGTPIASKLAEHFGGGGHPYASGFKILDGRSITDVKTECVKFATELLATKVNEE
ncbi:MAG: DHH family phosphoesterase [bacterium]|nr:DHH family phosphoesterase [bacterium]